MAGQRLPASSIYLVNHIKSGAMGKRKRKITEPVPPPPTSAPPKSPKVDAIVLHDAKFNAKIFLCATGVHLLFKIIYVPCVGPSLWVTWVVDNLLYVAMLKNKRRLILAIVHLESHAIRAIDDGLHDASTTLPADRLTMTRSPTLNCRSSGFFGAGTRWNVRWRRVLFQGRGCCTVVGDFHHRHAFPFGAP